jgi:peptidoglycan/xylan/chitin deacetylase (PgdA/CDA1 family)
MFQRKRARIREVVRWIADHGFDVGLHGSYWSALDVDALAKEKAVLERVVEHPVRSIRQHFLHWNILSTPRLQDEAGFAVDSTLGFNRHVGFRAGTCLPFHHFDAKNNRRLNLLQVPLIVQDAPLLADNSLELNEQLAWRVVQLLLDRVAHVSGVFTLLVHPHTLLNPLVSTLFRRTIEYALSKSAWVTSLRDMDEWWRAREERLSRPATLRK